MKTILVTGGAGFIGSCFVRRLLGGKNYRVINLDLLTYAGNMDNLKSVENDGNHVFVHGDICDGNLLDSLFGENDICAVVNFAAESHVDRSIDGPKIFVQTNIVGTQALLDAATKSWKLNPNDKYCREYKVGARFVQISTDEVYGSLGPEGLFSEETPLAPNSPYSASKASADMIVRAYFHTFGLPVNITRCSNNYGACQYPEKLIPLIIRNSLRDMPLPVYGDGLQIRDWLYVDDHCDAVLAVLENGLRGEVYNIGGNNEWTNIEIVKTILRQLGKPESLISYVKDRPGHDRRYAIDNTKIKNELGWAPAHTFEAGIKSTIEWYVNNEEWLARMDSLKEVTP